MENSDQRLADRLGKTIHVSPLRYRIGSLMKSYPSSDANSIEDWLVDVANQRGARVVTRSCSKDRIMPCVPYVELSNEELAVAICQLQCLDRPQMLRLAAQLISRGAVDPDRLRICALRERTEIVLKALATEALRVDHTHVLWKKINDFFKDIPAPRVPILHWTRLAWPVMTSRGVNAEKWVLVK